MGGQLQSLLVDFCKYTNTQIHKYANTFPWARKIWVGGQLPTPLFYFASLLEGEKSRYHQFPGLPHKLSSRNVRSVQNIILPFSNFLQYFMLRKWKCVKFQSRRWRWMVQSKCKIYANGPPSYYCDKVQHRRKHFIREQISFYLNLKWIKKRF